MRIERQVGNVCKLFFWWRAVQIRPCISAIRDKPIEAVWRNAANKLLPLYTAARSILPFIATYQRRLDNILTVSGEPLQLGQHITQQVSILSVDARRLPTH